MSLLSSAEHVLGDKQEVYGGRGEVIRLQQTDNRVTVTPNEKCRPLLDSSRDKWAGKKLHYTQCPLIDNCPLYSQHNVLLVIASLNDLS